MYAELDIQAKATQKMNEYYDIAMSNLAAISASDDQKAPLYALSRFLMSRDN